MIIPSERRGGRAKEEVRAFTPTCSFSQWPEEGEIQPVNDVVGDDQLPDERHVGFTHAKQMDWLLTRLRVARLLGAFGTGIRMWMHREC